MTKYSNEFKVKAIKMVLKGDSISHVAKILNMPNTASLCRWIFHYENGGISQLLHKNRKYTPIFKQKVFEYNDLLKKWHALMKQWEKEGR
ncbi:transposase, partial [Megamonas funiformis]|uniref:helix-turn-helix domain-containing protein n=1 Tax=Megamonas funiformis TaxID=437897 RepID=UPI000FF8240D